MARKLPPWMQEEMPFPPKKKPAKKPAKKKAPPKKGKK